MAPVGRVTRLGSFAKSLAPGLRLGWVTGDPALIGRQVDGGMLDSGGGLNHFTAMTAATLCASGAFDAQIIRLRAAYRAKRDALHAALAEHLPPGCTWELPGGGFFIWLRFPDGMGAEELLPRAEALGTAYAPGSRFYLDSRGANTARLAFSYFGTDQLAEAARLLGIAMKASP